MTSAIAEFLDRTRKGTRALLAAVRAGATEPERAGYVAAGGAAAGARLFGRARVATALRLTAPPLLAGAVLRSRLPVRSKVTLLAGLTAGWAGELEKARTPAAPSAVGVAGVAGEHLAYGVLLVDRGAQLTPLRGLSRGVLWASGVGLAASRNRALVPAAAIAGLAVSVTSALAGDRGIRTGAVSHEGIDHGANLVFVAEGLTLLRAVAGHRHRSTGRVLDAGTTAAAVLGNLLLVDGLVRSQASLPQAA